MPLSDRELKECLREGSLSVHPTEDRYIQPASIDVHLGPRLLVPKHELTCIDLGAGVDVSDMYDRIDMRNWGSYLLQPGEFVLGATSEYVSFASYLCGHFTGRSTLGRVGLLVHVTAGFCDPGFEGCITLEIKNLAPYAIKLSPGVGIGQILVERMDGAVDNPYGSKAVGSAYTGPNDGPVPPALARKL
jgi:dCTP deaminase